MISIDRYGVICLMVVGRPFIFPPIFLLPYSFNAAASASQPMVCLSLTQVPWFPGPIKSQGHPGSSSQELRHQLLVKTQDWLKTSSCLQALQAIVPNICLSLLQALQIQVCNALMSYAFSRLHPPVCIRTTCTIKPCYSSLSCSPWYVPTT